MHLTWKIVCFITSVNKAMSPIIISNKKFLQNLCQSVHVFHYSKSFDTTPNMLCTILFTENCNECLSAEFVGQTSLIMLCNSVTNPQTSWQPGKTINSKFAVIGYSRLVQHTLSYSLRRLSVIKYFC